MDSNGMEIFEANAKIPPEAQELKDQEEELFLATVPYDIFWGKIKLVGYTMQLRPEHMMLIGESINMDYEKDIHVPKTTTAKLLFCDEKFGYRSGVHEP